jgi:hypothetical protein
MLFSIDTMRFLCSKGNALPSLIDLHFICLSYLCERRRNENGLCIIEIQTNY